MPPDPWCGVALIGSDPGRRPLSIGPPGVLGTPGWRRRPRHTGGCTTNAHRESIRYDRLMAVPWGKIFNAVAGFAQIVRYVRAPEAGSADSERGGDLMATPRTAPGALEANLAGVVVAALKEAFARDAQRLEIEQARDAAERERAERALRLEMLRQATDREVARQRMIAGIGVVGLLAALVFSLLTGIASGVARVSFGLSALLLLGGIALAFAAQSHVSAAFAALGDLSKPLDPPSSGRPGLIAPWLIVAGFAAITIGVLVQ